MTAFDGCEIDAGFRRSRLAAAEALWEQMGSDVHGE